jgi:adenylate kinase
MKKNINVIIMGPQGSGKGTQIRLLIEKYGLQPIEVGNILREMATKDTPVGREVDEVINKRGELVSWDLLNKVLDEKVAAMDPEKGLIFDGTPRRMEEVEYWDKKFAEIGRKIDHIFYIDVSREESLKRISSRKLCRPNGHPLIVGKDITEDDKVCPICKGEIYRRDDDTPEKVAKRLSWNEEKMKPVVEYYEKKGMIMRVAGENSIEKIHQEIVSHIEK